MGNVTGTLIENAFQPQASNQPPVDIQEEIKRLARHSSNPELYRLLHVEMEHGARERISIAQSCPVTETAGAAGVKGIAAEKLESTRFSSDNFHAQGSSAPWKCRTDLPQTTELSPSRDRGCSGKYGNGDVVDSYNGKQVDGVTKVVSDQEESCSALRMAFKKKILNSYRTENEEPVKADNSTATNREKWMRIEEPVEPTGKNFTEHGQKAVTKVLNFDNCIQVIVMNELQKLEAAPDDSPGTKKLELFGKLGGNSDAQKNRSSEGDKNKVSRDRCSVESGWPSKTEKTAGQSASFEPKADKLSSYGCLESASQNPSDTSVHRTRARKVEVGQGGPSVRSTPSYRAVGHPEAPETPRMYLPSVGDGLARNSRQIGSQQVEVADGEVSVHYGPTPFTKYSHLGVWGHGQEHPAVQPSPHLLLADPGYRMTSSSQMAQPMVDHRRRVDREPESVRLQRPEYISYSGSSSQHSLIPSQPSQRSAYRNSPPVLLDKQHHRMDMASYMYPAKVASHDRVHGQYETSYLNQPEGLHPPVVSYLKNSPKNSPHLAYDKEPVHPVGEQQYSRTELLKTSPGCTLAGSVRNYRTATEPSKTGYRGERLSRPDPQLDKRSYGMNNGEDLEFEKYFRNPAASSNRDVPMGSDQRSFSTSFLPRGRDGLDRVVAGPTEESPLDLTTKWDVRNGHHDSVYLIPSGVKQHPPEWEMAKSIGYRPSYVREEDPVNANMFRPASQKASDFVVSEQVSRRDVMDGRQAYEKVPHGLMMMQPDSNYGRVIPLPAQERNTRASIVASHPFDDTASSLVPPSHLSMQQISEALMKSQHSANNWKPAAYQEVLPQSHAVILEPESSYQGGGPERARLRSGNPSGDLLHMTTTSPTIPHLSPIQPLVAPASGRRVSGPSLLGSHSPSDILHLQCKVCGSTYGSLRSFRMHFAKVHGLEPLPEHCNISTISGTKNAMSKIISVDDNEPPALQREPVLSDIGSSGRSRSFGYNQFSNGSRPVKPDALHSDMLPVTNRTEQVAQVYPMPMRVTHGLSPQLKVDPVVRRPSLNDTQMEPTETKTKMANDTKGGGRVVNCDLGIIRSRNCYSDVGCDVDCPECLDGFKDISDWKMHISTHMMRSCSCKACNLSFTHSGALKRHLQTAHAPTEKVDVEFRCLFCREAFSDEKVLFQHTQEHEKKYSRVENTRRESSSSQIYRQHDGSVDSDGIQMAIPDTTSSDDLRPTSGFRENSSNISPSTDSKGSSFDRRSFADLLASGPPNAVEPDNFRRFGDAKTEDENASCRVGVMGQSGKTIGRSRSPGSASVALSESSDAEREAKAPARVSEDSVAFVSKKQAFLKRFKSTEERESVDSDTSQLSSLSAQPGSNGALSAGRPGSVVVLADNADVQQPMHLRDLFSIMSHQVEKSIRGIPDFPPVTSFVPAQRSRCVRDVCDEIIAQSFRKDRIPRDGVSSLSMLEGFEPSSDDNMKEQFKVLGDVESDSHAPEVQRLRPGAEVSGAPQAGGWAASPYSSRDSYHSLEIDESQFDKERSLDDSAETGRSKCADRRGVNCDELSPRPGSKQHSATDLPERRKCDDGDDSFRALESEIGGVQPSERFFGRQGKPADSEGCAGRADSANLKESCSPSSTQKLDVCGGETEGGADPSAGRGQKRKRSTSDVSEAGVAGDDSVPAREKILCH